jgi:hypothetical protein
VQDIAEQAGHARGRGGVVFQTVSDGALLGTVLISGALAAVHLWKALFPKPREGRDRAEELGPVVRREVERALAEHDRHRGWGARLTATAGEEGPGPGRGR